MITKSNVDRVSSDEVRFKSLHSIPIIWY